MPTTIILSASKSQIDGLLVLLEKFTQLFSQYHLVATETTATRIREVTGLAVESVTSAANGGLLQAASCCITDDVSSVICLFDSKQIYPYQSDLEALSRICNIHNIPLATNLATAELMIRAITKNRVAYLLFNPVAGQGNPDQDLAMIRQVLAPYLDLHVVFTQPTVDPADQAKKIIAQIQDSQEEDGSSFIIASGGDGTVSAIAGATIETGIPLGVIPRGTANAFAVALGLPTNLKAACDNIASGNTRQVDAARCNHIPMILLAGIGFEAGMVNKADRDLKNRLGSLAYIISGAQQIFEQEPFKVFLEIDDKEMELQTGAITVANAAPPTSVLAQGFGEVIPDDGVLDVTISVTQDRLQGINTLASLFTSALVKSQFQREDIICLRTNRLKITTDPPQTLVIDGEIIEANPIEFECIPQGLTVFSPLSTV